MVRDRTRVDVSRAGAANAETGGIANSGYIGSISVVHAGPVVRSSYLEQVRRLAPYSSPTAMRSWRSWPASAPSRTAALTRGGRPGPGQASRR